MDGAMLKVRHFIADQPASKLLSLESISRVLKTEMKNCETRRTKMMMGAAKAQRLNGKSVIQPVQTVTDEIQRGLNNATP
jgi:hypothetical protein